MDRFPQLPADVADKELARLTIEAHPPRIAEAVSPYLGPCSFHFDERIVFRNGIVLSLVFMVHVDAQNGEKEGRRYPVRY